MLQFGLRSGLSTAKDQSRTVAAVSLLVQGDRARGEPLLARRGRRPFWTRRVVFIPMRFLRRLRALFMFLPKRPDGRSQLEGVGFYRSFFDTLPRVNAKTSSPLAGASTVALDEESHAPAGEAPLDVAE